MKSLSYTEAVLLMGADPELFLSRNDEIIGSEKVIPEEGIKENIYNNKIVRDGVQIEINPNPASCRAYLGNDISRCFKEIKKILLTNYPDVKLDFRPMIKVKRKEFNSLSDKSKVFGCEPSMNIYENTQSQIKVNPKRYLKRSGGGHLHFGVNFNNEHIRRTFNNPKKLVPMFDMLLGYTCVLLDKNKSNIVRRLYYGKAGEYRQ